MCMINYVTSQINEISLTAVEGYYVHPKNDDFVACVQSSSSPVPWKCSEEYFSYLIRSRDPLQLGSGFSFPLLVHFS